MHRAMTHDLFMGVKKLLARPPVPRVVAPAGVELEPDDVVVLGIS